MNKLQKVLVIVSATIQVLLSLPLGPKDPDSGLVEIYFSIYSFGFSILLLLLLVSCLIEAFKRKTIKENLCYLIILLIVIIYPLIRFLWIN